MDCAERIKILRKELKLSQPAFGLAIGVSRDVVANLEYGRVELKESTLKLICKTFSVNPLWLTEGKGEMFFDVANQLTDDLCRAYNLTDIEAEFLKTYLKLPPEERQAAIKALRKFYEV